MSNEFPDIEPTQDGLDALGGQVTAMLQRVTALRAQALALTASARSYDRLVEVWVNANGVVIQVDIDRDAYSELSPEALGSRIAETAQQAAREVQAQVNEKLAAIEEATGMANIRQKLAGIPELAGLAGQAVASMAGPQSEERRFMPGDGDSERNYR
ncbi:YbaB/EbfC family nucleoid-associated protein [Williamsia sp. CHRR-6]|uniref:YbaB/EbfC family nucleoid-associated protein n=1 Tax=Williamsia sp. CHRR-6 TaxID=2835871 RepID=UPI001BDA0990|nr:YbaB/EbfC family nucleoid-associated protein [Williamsia sp. CHRR-6]MBT0567149.1 YbaB/EbfC family nucleoid-associated protein [Williamsia sp. CHRR-6]